MKNSKILGLCVLALPLTLCCGCGGGGSSKLTVEFWHTFGSNTVKALEDKATEFQKILKEKSGLDFEIKFSYQGSYNDINTKIISGYSTGSLPTMTVAYPNHVADYLTANSDPVYNLEDYFTDSTIGFGKQSYLGDDPSYDKDDFVTKFIEEGSHYIKKGTYSLPFMKSSEVMFYNEDAYLDYMSTLQPAWSEQQAIEYLENIGWEDFMTLCDSINKIKDPQAALETPLYYDSDENFFISKMFQNKIPYSSITAQNKGNVDFDKAYSQKNYDDTASMLQTLQTQYKNKVFQTKGTVGKYGSDYFKTEKCIFDIASSGGTGYQMPAGGAFNVGVCKAPASNDNPLYISQGPTLAFLKNPKWSKEENDQKMSIAWQFAKYLTNPELNVYCCIYGSQGYLPVRESAYETKSFKDFMKADDIYAHSLKVLMEKINGKYINETIFKGSSKLRTVVGSMLTDILKENNTITDAMDSAINQAKLAF